MGARCTITCAPTVAAAIAENADRAIESIMSEQSELKRGDLCQTILHRRERGTCMNSASATKIRNELEASAP